MPWIKFLVTFPWKLFCWKNSYKVGPLRKKLNNMDFYNTNGIYSINTKNVKIGHATAENAWILSVDLNLKELSL
jgi:hypothetical protein